MSPMHPIQVAGRRAGVARQRLLGGVLLTTALLVFASDLYQRHRPLPVAIGPELAPDLARLVTEHAGQVARAPDSAAACGELAMVYLANSLFDDARDWFTKAAGLAPEEPLWRYYLAVASHETGNAREAARLFESVVDEMGSHAVVHQRLGQALLELGRLEEARSTFAALVTVAPGEAEGYIGLGEVALSQRDWPAAVTLLEHAVELAPDYRRARYGLGLAYRGVGNLEEAREQLNRGSSTAIRYFTDPSGGALARLAVHVDAQLSRAQDLQAARRFQEAISLLQKLIPAHPEHAGVRNQLATCTIEMGQLEKAESLLSQYVTLAPKHVPTRISRAECLYRLRRLDAALVEARIAVKLDPDLSLTHFVEARILALGNDLDGARAALERTLERDPRNTHARAFLGRVCQALGHDDEARSQLEASLELAPDHPEPRFDLIAILTAAGDRQGARQHLEVVRKLAPGDPRVAQLESVLTEDDR